KLAHRAVVADLEAELGRVELLGPILVEHVDGGVAELLNHGCPRSTAPGAGLLQDCGPSPPRSANRRRKHAGTYSSGQPCGRATTRRTSRSQPRGEAPVWRRNSVLNEPTLENPTSKHTCVTDDWSRTRRCLACS